MFATLAGPRCAACQLTLATSIYDAILLASRSLERRGEDRRRVMILVTDAGEND